MGGDLRMLCANVSHLKAVILQNKNLDVLLYLAKCSPSACVSDIVEKFGREALVGLKELEKFDLVDEQDGQLTLTEEGIFRVDGLLSIAV